MKGKTTTAILACLLAVSLLLAGCAMAGRPQLEPQAGQWQTWVLTSSDEVQPPAPPDRAATLAEIADMKQMAAGDDGTAKDLVAYWDAGSPSYRWLAMAVDQFAQAKIPPSPKLSRGLSLMNVAVYDAMIAAWKAKYAYNRLRPSQVDPTLPTLITAPASPSYPCEHAVAAGAAATVLAYLFPDNADMFMAKAEEEGRSRVLAGVQYPSDVAAGLALGKAVAEKVIESAKADGSDVVWDGTMPSGPGYWTGEKPVDPVSGSWKTWVLASGDQFRPPPPPAYDSEQMHTELMALETYTPTFASNATAYFWQSPAGGPIYWYNVASRDLFEHRLDQDSPLAARVYAAISVAQHDAFVACYDAKYAYWSMRPFQVDTAFKPLFNTPNHPSYPSAHSCQSAAIATVMASLFPAEAEAAWKAAEEAGNSRMWAGIHFQSDVDAGLALGKKVGELVAQRVAAMSQP